MEKNLELTSSVTRKLLALCGIISPILVITVGVVATQLRPSYNSVTQFGSELGVGTDAAALVARTSFLLYGVLTFAFALGLQIGIGKGEGSKIGPALLGLYGVGFATSAVFPCDPGCPLPTQGPSIVQSIHWTLFIIGTVSTVLAPLIISERLRSDNLWKGYRSYTIATGVASLGLFIVFFSGVLLSNLLAPWRGTFEAVLFFPSLIWTEVMAIRLIRLPALPTSTVVPSASTRP